MEGRETERIDVNNTDEKIMQITQTLAVLALLIPLATGSVDRAAGNVERNRTDVTKIVAKARQLNSSTTAATIRFTQSGGGEDGSGKLDYAQGNRFRLELPSRTIVSNGELTWSWTPAKKQVIINRAATGGQLTPNDILQSFPGDYSTTLAGETTIGGNAVWIVNATASGDRKLGDISSAVLYIDKESYRFRKISVTSPSMGNLTLQITSASYNVTIPDSRFIFTPPEGAKVIDLS